MIDLEVDILKDPYCIEHGMLMGSFYRKRDKLLEYYRKGEISLQEFSNLYKTEAIPDLKRAKGLIKIFEKSLVETTPGW